MCIAAILLAMGKWFLILKVRVNLEFGFKCITFIYSQFLNLHLCLPLQIVNNFHGVCFLFHMTIPEPVSITIEKTLAL